MMMLDENTSKIVLTTNMWTSNQKNCYMVVTSHFIDNMWKLHSRILRFIYVPSPHNAITLIDELWNCLLDWNVDGKLSVGLECFKDRLDVIGDGIEKIRETVIYLTQSSRRLELLEDIAIRQLKMKSPKKLVLGCKTRWNSAYMMLDVALMYIYYFFSRMYGIDYELETQRIFELCNDLVSEYQAKEKGGLSEGIGESGVCNSFTSSSSSSPMWDVKGFESYKRKHGHHRKLTLN
ncbi:hypothetical protein EZV62_014771 [Acer yangbiense]|uniref:hAT-like transposase RNase-H fold domain-containing protein n=1 Tax=Acer yangbiense TaxID=1000413 RepID=A0A5C7HTM9_9ROSI|nr:hypothetical protein EZV62_014771 [Acer yangbiense]